MRRWHPPSTILVFFLAPIRHVCSADVPSSMILFSAWLSTLTIFYIFRPATPLRERLKPSFNCFSSDEQHDSSVLVLFGIVVIFLIIFQFTPTNPFFISSTPRYDRLQFDAVLVPKWPSYWSHTLNWSWSSTSSVGPTKLCPSIQQRWLHLVIYMHQTGSFSHYQPALRLQSQNIWWSPGLRPLGFEVFERFVLSWHFLH